MITFDNRKENLCLTLLGDGYAAMALQGLDIVYVKSVYLAGRNQFTCRVLDDAHICAQGSRLPGRFRYQHQVTRDGRRIGTVSDYFSTGGSFVREFSLTEELSFKMALDQCVQVYQDGYYTPKGSYYVNDYPTGEDAYFRVDLTSGSLKKENDILYITLSGNGRLAIRFAPTLPEPESDIEEYNVPCPVAKEGVLGQIYEDYWYAYRALHSRHGGTVSHLIWNLNYVRDNYGMCRGLLAMGLVEEVKKQLAFDLAVFKKHGFLATAQSVGCDETFHVHECDETENPGYLVMGAFDYLAATGDKEFFMTLIPMLQWAVQAQARHLYDGMMPFCGDETYIAGKVLPRTVLEHGSCESTMLFIQSVKLLQPYWQDEEINRLCEEAERKFFRNFWDNGLLTNQPTRAKAPLPAKKHGPCVFCYAMTDIYPNAIGIYTCKNCADRTEDLRVKHSYRLPCVEMEPSYFEFEMISQEQRKAICERYARTLLEEGCISKQGAEKKSMGYEYGLLLHGLVQVKSDLAPSVREIILSRRSEHGIWDEYYDLQGNPTGMRCRLWESGVNIMALTEYEQVYPV